MAFGVGTINNIGGAVSDLFSSEAKSDQLRLNATGLRLKSRGDLVEGENYDLAADLAGQNKIFAQQSTAVKQTMADRQIYQGVGTETADISGAGLRRSGSALDLLRSSASQGALQKQLIGQQGLITEAGYDEQIKSYKNLADYAQYASSIDEDMANDTEALAGKAEQQGQISAGIKGVAALASLFV